VSDVLIVWYDYKNHGGDLLLIDATDEGYAYLEAFRYLNEAGVYSDIESSKAGELCYRCKGTGQRIVPVWQGQSSRDHIVAHACPDCKGTGKAWADIDDGQVALYDKACEGSALAAKHLLKIRNDYEYERVSQRPLFCPVPTT